MRLKLIAGLLAATCLTTTALAANRIAPGLSDPGPERGDEPAGGGACPGVAITSLPFTDSGTNCGSTDTVSNYGKCTTDPYPGPDEVYQITVGSGNNVTFNLDIAGSAGDLAMILLSSCGDGSTCLGGSDEIGIGVGPETIGPASLTPGTYFVYIDSYYGAPTAGNCGNFTFSVTGTVPVELESFDVL